MALAALGRVSQSASCEQLQQATRLIDSHFDGLSGFGMIWLERWRTVPIALSLAQSNCQVGICFYRGYSLGHQPVKIIQLLGPALEVSRVLRATVPVKPRRSTVAPSRTSHYEVSTWRALRCQRARRATREAKRQQVISRANSPMHGRVR